MFLFLIRYYVSFETGNVTKPPPPEFRGQPYPFVVEVTFFYTGLKQENGI